MIRTFTALVAGVCLLLCLAWPLAARSQGGGASSLQTSIGAAVDGLSRTGTPAVERVLVSEAATDGLPLPTGQPLGRQRQWSRGGRSDARARADGRRARHRRVQFRRKLGRTGDDEPA